MYTHTFTVEDMSCDHCVSAIEHAVQACDPAAQVMVDLIGKRVQVDSTEPAEAFAAAIRAAGYTPVSV